MSEIRPNISIIVPVYNVEKYLNRCLDSVFNQEFNGSFEVIAVDDKSTDNSLHILKKYALHQTRLKIVEHKKNMKLSLARTTGMKIALGDYIMHVDSDDWLLPGALNGLYKKIKETDADVIIYNYLTEDSNGKRKHIKKVRKEFFGTNKVDIQKYFIGAVWNKIVKRNLVENMIYMNKSINHAEDLLYATEILIRASKFVFVKDFYYVYYKNLNSLTRTTTLQSEYQTLTNITNELTILLNNYNNHDLIKPIFDLRFKYSLDFAIKNYFSKKKGIIFHDLIFELNKLHPSNQLKNDLNKLFNSPVYFLNKFICGDISLRHFGLFMKRCYRFFFN